MQKTNEHSDELPDAATCVGANRRFEEFPPYHDWSTQMLNTRYGPPLEALPPGLMLPRYPEHGHESAQHNDQATDNNEPHQAFIGHQNTQGTHADVSPNWQKSSNAPGAGFQQLPSDSVHGNANPSMNGFHNAFAQPYRPPPLHRNSEPARYTANNDTGAHPERLGRFSLRPSQTLPQSFEYGVSRTQDVPANIPQSSTNIFGRRTRPSEASRGDGGCYSQTYPDTHAADRQENHVDIEQTHGSSHVKPGSGRSARPQAPGAGRQRDKFQCVDCLKLNRENFYCHTECTGARPGEERCRKHQAKWVKEQASTQAPTYHFDEDISSFEQAKTLVYPAVRALVYTGKDEDDFMRYKHAEDEWIKRFIDAANLKYTDASGTSRTRTAGQNELEYQKELEGQKREHEHLLKQQDTYNHKPHEKSSKESYTNDFINIRMRFLFRAILTYHEGGPAIYPVGGANGGYGDDTNLSMSQRLATIEDILKQEKRVVMDVIEGRGVLALAANPKHYMDRKQSNNKCNTKKKGKFAIADAVEAGRTGQDDTPTPGRTRGRGKRKAESQGQNRTSSKRSTPVPGVNNPVQPTYIAPAADMTRFVSEKEAHAGKYDQPEPLDPRDMAHVGNADVEAGEPWEQQWRVPNGLPSHNHQHDQYHVAYTGLEFQRQQSSSHAVPPGVAATAGSNVGPDSGEARAPSRDFGALRESLKLFMAERDVRSADNTLDNHSEVRFEDGPDFDGTIDPLLTIKAVTGHHGNSEG